MSVTFDGVKVTYENRSPALSAVSGSVAQGGWLMPIGPNGAGKSTLLRAIAGLIAFDGTITIGDQSVADIDRRALARLIAFVPQRPQIPTAMTVGDYVLLGRTPHISYFGSERRSDREIVWEVLDRLGLVDFADRPMGHISGGEAQRAVIGRALAQEAEVLLLDEPTSSLDLGQQQQVLELVDELRRERGLTVISTMHDLGLAGQFGEQFVLIASGEIVAEGGAKDVLTASLIEKHYNARVRVLVMEDDRILITPTRSREITRDRDHAYDPNVSTVNGKEA